MARYRGSCLGATKRSEQITSTPGYERCAFTIDLIADAKERSKARRCGVDISLGSFRAWSAIVFMRWVSSSRIAWIDDNSALD